MQLCGFCFTFVLTSVIIRHFNYTYFLLFSPQIILWSTSDSVPYELYYMVSKKTVDEKFQSKSRFRTMQ